MQLRIKEADFSKEKAVLQQKVEQLEQQVREAIQREDSQKKMYEQIINCLQPNQPEQNQRSVAEKAAQQEISELKDQKRRIIDEFEQRDRDLRQQISEKDMIVKDVQLSIERILMDKRQLQYLMESEKKELQARIQILQTEKEQVESKIELKTQSKFNELQMEIERLKLEHQREVEKVKAEYDCSLKEIKYFHDQEKNNLELRVEKSTNELKSLMGIVKARENQDEQQIEKRQLNREELEQEIEYLQQEVENAKQLWEDQMEQLRQDKELAEKQSKKLQKQLDKIKNAPKPIKIDLTSLEQEEQQQKQIKNLKFEIEQLQQENSKLSDQTKKQRRELLDNQDYIEKIEQNERKIRNLLKEREQDIENEKSDLKKLLNQEKKKVFEAQESQNKLRDSYDKVKNKHLQEMLDKDEKIIKLTRELRECEKKLQEQSNKTHQRTVSPFNIESQHNRTISTYSPLGGVTQQNFMFPSSIQQQSPQRESSQNEQQVAMMKQVSQLELTLLKTCQRMADSASRMECSHCLNIFFTSDFYDHIMQEHPIKTSLNNTTHQSSASIGVPYQSKQTSQTQLVKRTFVEDNSSNQSISPRSQLLSSKNFKQKFHQNSRSFTCLLNEIEEEEKLSSDSHMHTQLSTQQTQHNKKKTIIQNQDIKKVDKVLKRSRNISNSTVIIGGTNSTIGQGNTLSSVLKSTTKHLNKKQSKFANASTSNQQQPVTVLTACRTEIQNLKKQNKKLSTQVQQQETKIQDVSRECSVLKRKSQKEERLNASKLTCEIKDLLEKLVTYQGDKQLTARQQSDIQQMNTESIIQLRSSTSMSSINDKKKHKPNKISKSPIDRQGQSKQIANKENLYSNQKQSKTPVQVPKLKYVPKIQSKENHIPSDDQCESAKCQTDRRYHEVSQTNCTNSPNRYQNYFEVLQSIPSSAQENMFQKKVSPIKESIKNTQRYYVRGGCQNEGNSRNNSNLPMIYNSKNTINSSQHNLVLYDSNNTDMFKSKQLMKYSCQKQIGNQTGCDDGVRKLDFDEQCYYNDEDDLKNPSSSCPSLNEFEETHRIVEEDPFVTGRFCQGGCEGGKQFVFKPSNKNSTMKTHKLIFQ